MYKSLFAASVAAVAAFTPFAASAQDTSTTGTAAAEPTAPDGSRAFGIEPYVGIGGAYQDFDSGTRGEFELNGSARAPAIDAFAGVNIPLGPLVVGVEAQGSKGFQDIDWEYGATGHVGFRAGETGIIFARAGYRWIEGRRGFRNDRNEIYGLGVEVGPDNIGLGGLTGNAGVRLRLLVDTFDLQSIRPSAAVVLHF